jgi:hypothetical protein
MELPELDAAMGRRRSAPSRLADAASRFTDDLRAIKGGTLFRMIL